VAKYYVGQTQHATLLSLFFSVTLSFSLSRESPSVSHASERCYPSNNLFLTQYFFYFPPLLFVQDNKLKRRAAFKRAESYVKEYRAKESEEVRLKRVAKEQGGFYFKGEAKVLFVIRIRGLMDVHPKTKKILQLMRLRQMNNGVFMKVNKASINMLKRVEPYVTYGEPNLKSVRELIYKRGFGKVGAGKQRIALTDNSIIEGELGKHGIVCIEDLIHEIITMGPKFKEANNFLWPFQLNAPKGALGKFCVKRPVSVLGLVSMKFVHFFLHTMRVYRGPFSSIFYA